MKQSYLLIGVSLTIAILLCSLSWNVPLSDESSTLRQFLFSPLQSTPQLIEDTLPLPDSLPSLTEQKDKLLDMATPFTWEAKHQDEVIQAPSGDDKAMTLLSALMKTFLTLYSK
ncbi:MAG: hypothetical protein AAF399_08215 [Bacteroidota bacterium]